MQNNSIKYRINYSALIILAFVIPLERRLIAPATILFVATSIFNVNTSLFRTKKNWLFFAGVYFIYLIGLSYTDDLAIGLKDLMVKLPLLLIPFSFFFSGLNFKQINKNVLIAFQSGCLLAILVSLINSLIQYANSGDIDCFFYDKVTYFTHPSYMAMLCNFSIISLYYLLSKSTRLKPAHLIALVAFLSIYVVMLVSKTGLITMVLTHLAVIGYYIVQQKKYLTIISLLAVISLSVLAAYHGSDKFKDRILEVSAVSSNKTSSTSARKIIWGVSLDLIWEKPIFGYGTGNATNQLLNAYENIGNDYLISKKLNAHNQFIQTTLAIGLFGGIVLLLMFLLPFISAIKHKNYLLLFFLLLMLINFATESMLERQVGVTFYALFNLLCLSFNQEEQKSKQI